MCFFCFLKFSFNFCVNKITHIVRLCLSHVTVFKMTQVLIIQHKTRGFFSKWTLEKKMNLVFSYEWSLSQPRKQRNKVHEPKHVSNLGVLRMWHKYGEMREKERGKRKRKENQKTTILWLPPSSIGIEIVIIVIYLIISVHLIVHGLCHPKCHMTIPRISAQFADTAESTTCWWNTKTEATLDLGQWRQPTSAWLGKPTRTRSEE